MGCGEMEAGTFLIGYFSHNGEDYERWIVEDVVGSVCEVEACVDEASPIIFFWVIDGRLCITSTWS